MICLDKDQENLAELFEKYPLLYNVGHILWLEQWSPETLRQMPQLIIQRYQRSHSCFALLHFDFDTGTVFTL